VSHWWHRWTAWSEARLVPIVYVNVNGRQLGGHEMYQYRTCRKCGLTKERKVE
jgi:hypothetical protein